MEMADSVARVKEELEQKEEYEQGQEWKSR